MKGLLLSIGALAALLSLTVGVNRVLAANHSASAGAKVAVANSELGRLLVDGRGRTLYLFEKDKHGRSTCTGKCASFWLGRTRLGAVAAKIPSSSSRPNCNSKSSPRVASIKANLPSIKARTSTCRPISDAVYR